MSQDNPGTKCSEDLGTKFLEEFTSHLWLLPSTHLCEKPHPETGGNLPED